MADQIKLEKTLSMICSMTQTDIEDRLTQLENQNLNFRGERNTLKIAFEILGDNENRIDTDTIDMDRLADKERVQTTRLNQLKSHCKLLNIHNESSTDYEENEFSIIDRINRLIEVYRDSFEQILYHKRQLDRINNPYQISVKTDVDGSHYRWNGFDENDEKRSPYQDFLICLLTELHNNQLRRYKDQCYVVKKVQGRSTRAWEPKMSIKDFVYTYANKDIQYKQWKNMTACGADKAIKHLTECIDREFQDLRKNRHVWSFKNGLFNGRIKNDDGSFSTKFYEYDSSEYDNLDPTLVSSKYFDIDFKDYSGISDWYDIPTPTLQSILDYQKFPEAVCKWVYVFCGRMCFEVKDLDNWQVMAFMKGFAGTGKSTIVNMCAQFYEASDVRVLSNNVERKFGLGSIYDGLVFVAPEIKSDMCLAAEEFQSMTSGEEMSIARKHSSAITLKWKIPGMLGGNENPGWKDNNGQIYRRIVPWYYGIQVRPEDSDPKMDDKIQQELPMILQKCVMAYVDYSNKYRDRDIWSVLPLYFKRNRDMMAMVSSVILSFLGSEKVRYGEGLFVPQSVFTRIFNRHCEDNNLPKQKFTHDLYAGPFESKNLKIKTMSSEYKNLMYTDQPFIVGMDIVNTEAQYNFSDDA